MIHNRWQIESGVGAQTGKHRDDPQMNSAGFGESPVIQLRSRYKSAHYLTAGSIHSQFNRASASRSQLTLPSVGGNTGDNGGVGRTRGDVLALEFGEEALIRLFEGSGTCEAVDLAGMAKVGGADLVGSAIGRSEELAGNG